ncbi:MAG TPA: hypothetical protein VKF59_06400 [Candidatus Dormibacteraeota bacterium]|nr:hypothetical protein [Candidatus Dormibacteraeota bacterium]
MDRTRKAEVGLSPDPQADVLTPGALADIVAFRADLMECPVDDLPALAPDLTLVSGRAVHDPDGRLTSAGQAPGSG